MPVVFVAAALGCIVKSACQPLAKDCEHDARCAFGSLAVYNNVMDGVAVATNNCTAAPIICDADVARYADVLFSPGCSPNPETHAAAAIACASSIAVRSGAVAPMLCDTDKGLTLEDDLFAAVIIVVAVFLGYRAARRDVAARVDPEAKNR